MAKSLAFWVDGINPEDRPSVDIHINYWLLNQSTKNELNYLDIGVKFDGLRHDPDVKINIYFPFKVKREQYFPGLGALVCSRTDLIQTIFNSRHESTQNTSNTSVDIKFADGEVLRVHKQIDLGPGGNEGVSITDTDDGTILMFPLEVFFGGDARSSTSGFLRFGRTAKPSIPGYFRFRIILDKEEGRKAISQSYKHSDRYILSRLESTEIVDFRINEVRDLPGIIQSKDLLSSGVKNIHFFLIREVDSEFKQAHANFHRCRLLEKELWRSYLDPNSEGRVKLPPQMLIYHWKECAGKGNSKSIEKFNAFAKFGKITVTSTTVFSFAIAALVIGAFAGVAGNFLSKYILE